MVKHANNGCGRRPSPTMAAAAAVLAAAMLAGCSQGPDMSGIAAERERSVRRYDISQAIAANGQVVVAGTQSGAALVSADRGAT